LLIYLPLLGCCRHLDDAAASSRDAATAATACTEVR
jgi:hypothetical protein